MLNRCFGVRHTLSPPPGGPPSAPHRRLPWAHARQKAAFPTARQPPPPHRCLSIQHLTSIPPPKEARISLWHGGMISCPSAGFAVFLEGFSFQRPTKTRVQPCGKEGIGSRPISFEKPVYLIGLDPAKNSINRCPEARVREAAQRYSLG